MAPKRRVADLARWVNSLSPAQRERFSAKVRNAPSIRYGRSPQWQALARAFFAASPEMAGVAKQFQDPSTATGQLYGLLRDLANRDHESMFKSALNLPPNAPRSEMLGRILDLYPSLRPIVGDTPSAFDRALSNVKTMAATEYLGVRRFARDVENLKGEGKDWDGPEKLRQTFPESERARMESNASRRRTIEWAARQSVASAPISKRFERLPRPMTSRMALLHSAYAAHSGKPLALDPSSPGLREFEERNPNNSRVDEMHEQIRQEVQASDQAVQQWESSLQDTPAEAEAAAEQWERNNNGNG